ncbi:hypothetical protein GCM10009793_30560 [Brachybacterium phenoliresistens]
MTSALDRARQMKHRAFVLRRGLAAASAGACFRMARRSTVRRAAAAMDLPRLPHTPGTIWAVMMVRDESDVIEETIGQLLAEGVENVLVADNGSTDGTRDLLGTLSRDSRIHVGDDLWTAYEQSAKMTVLADAARRAGATWVLPVDADERWMGKTGTIAEQLRAATRPILQAELVNVFPSPEGDGTWRLDPVPHHDPKVAFMASRGAVVAMGNHRALRFGDIDGGLGIVHLPWRSPEQLRRKVQQGATALGEARVGKNAGWHWRRLGIMDDAQLAAVWNQILRGEPVPENAWQPGPVTVPFALSPHLSWNRVEQARREAREEPPSSRAGI